MFASHLLLDLRPMVSLLQKSFDLRSRCTEWLWPNGGVSFSSLLSFFLIRVVVTRSHYCGQMEVFVVASAKRSCTHLSCSQDSLLREIFFDLPRTTWICKQSLVSTSSNLPRGDLTLSIIRIDDSLTRLWLIEKVKTRPQKQECLFRMTPPNQSQENFNPSWWIDWIEDCAKAAEDYFCKVSAIFSESLCNTLKALSEVAQSWDC